MRDGRCRCDELREKGEWGTPVKEELMKIFEKPTLKVR